MQISLNGDVVELDDGLHVDGLIEKLQLQGKRLAVEVNEELVPRSQFASHPLNGGDRVEIVGAIGGG